MPFVIFGVSVFVFSAGLVAFPKSVRKERTRAFVCAGLIVPAAAVAITVLVTSFVYSNFTPARDMQADPVEVIDIAPLSDKSFVEVNFNRLSFGERADGLVQADSIEFNRGSSNIFVSEDPDEQARIEVFEICKGGFMKTFSMSSGCRTSIDVYLPAGSVDNLKDVSL